VRHARCGKPTALAAATVAPTRHAADLTDDGHLADVPRPVSRCPVSGVKRTLFRRLPNVCE